MKTDISGNDCSCELKPSQRYVVVRGVGWSGAPARPANARSGEHNNPNGRLGRSSWRARPTVIVGNGPIQAPTGPSRPSRIGPRWPGLYRQRLRQRLRLTLNYLSAHTCPPRRPARRSALLAAHAPQPAICFTLRSARRVERRRHSLSWPIPRAGARERCPLPWGGGIGTLDTVYSV